MIKGMITQDPVQKLEEVKCVFQVGRVKRTELRVGGEAGRRGLSPYGPQEARDTGGKEILGFPPGQPEC